MVYQPEHDHEALTAKQISHMIWYILDGRSRGRREAKIDERDSFNEYHMAFAEVDTTFLQSKNRALVDAAAGQTFYRLQLQGLPAGQQQRNSGTLVARAGAELSSGNAGGERKTDLSTVHS